MYIIKFRHLLAACIAISVSPLPASAQQGTDAPPPPQLEKLEEGEPPTTPARGPDQPRSVVTEKRAYGGRVTEIEVQSGGSKYYLQPNAQGGSSLPGDMDSNRMRGPQWRVKEFDLRRGDESRKASEPTAGVPPPPTVPAPTAPPR